MPNPNSKESIQYLIEHAKHCSVLFQQEYWINRVVGLPFHYAMEKSPVTSSLIVVKGGEATPLNHDGRVLLAWIMGYPEVGSRVRCTAGPLGAEGVLQDYQGDMTARITDGSASWIMNPQDLEVLPKRARKVKSG